MPERGQGKTTRRRGGKMSRKHFLGLWRYLLLAIVLVSLLVLLIPLSVVKADSVVTFPDPNLEAVIRTAVGKPTGDISQSDLVGLKSLAADNTSIIDLTGLEHCTSLTELDISSNEISDISPLSGLTSLGELDLSSNEIIDISPLSGLTSLEYLYLGGNQIIDISPLSGLTRLNLLDLWGNQIIDVSPVSGLTSLWGLVLKGNQISDISPLSGFTSLTYLDLGGNQISDIEPLVNNPGLSSGDRVYIQDNPLSSTSIDTCIPQLQARGVTVHYNAPSNQAPNQPSNVSPANAATGVSLTPTLQSSAFSDPDVGDTQAASNWQVTTVPGDYSSTVLDSGTDNSNLVQITLSSGVLGSNTTYYWHVRHQDNHADWSSWSSETSFVTIAGGQAKSGLPSWVWILVGVGVVLIAGGLAYFVRSRRVRQ